MQSALARLRRVLADIALPPDAQLRLFPIADSATIELMREYEQAHSNVEVARAEWLPPLVRQVLDELAFQFLSASPLMYCEPAVEYWTDQFLRESEFWTEARALAAWALRMLGEAGSKPEGLAGADKGIAGQGDSGDYRGEKPT